MLAVKYDEAPESDPRILIAAVSLRRVSDYLATVATADRDVLLLDRQSRVVASGRDVGPARNALNRPPR